MMSDFIHVETRWNTRCLKHFLRAPTFFPSPKRGITPRKIIESDLPLHINSFITTKFRKILLSGFRGVALTNCFSSIFHFDQISKFKKGVIPSKKWIKIVVDMHMFTLCPSFLQSFTKFCWAVSEVLHWHTRSVVSFILVKFQVKKERNSEKKINHNFLWICTSTHYVLQFHEVIRNSVERFQRGCADKKSRTDGLTEGRVKNIIPSATRCMGYNKCSLTCECEFQSTVLGLIKFWWLN